LFIFHICRAGKNALQYDVLSKKTLMIVMRLSFLAAVSAVALFAFSALSADKTLSVIEQLAASDPKPFVVVEATGTGVINRAQGVVLTPDGLVLSAGHVSWIDANQSFTDHFRVSFRGTGEGLPAGSIHKHKAIFKDRENTPFFEHYYTADLLWNAGTRFVAQDDLALFRIKGERNFPCITFYSHEKPDVRIGETFYLCHYTFPHKPADPLFLINPVEVVGVAETPSGLQYLAKGYYRVGSSGGALLKDGRLIGIQSAAYTVNAKEVGEIPLGLISFDLVWGDLFDGLLNAPPPGDAKAESKAGLGK
jgi:hypothetical protein